MHAYLDFRGGDCLVFACLFSHVFGESDDADLHGGSTHVEKNNSVGNIEGSIHRVVECCSSILLDQREYAKIGDVG